MAITDYDAKLAAIHSVYVDAAKDALEKAPSEWKQFCMEVPVNGTKIHPAFLTNRPKLKEWVGSRSVEALRANGVSYPVKSREATFGVSRVELQGDVSGLLAGQIAEQAADAPKLYSELAMETLIAGATELGYDGVTFFNAAHPHGPAGSLTQTNLGTAALDATSFDTARKTMRGLRQENGRSCGITPSLLIVGSKNERVAKSIVEAPLGSAGATNVDSMFDVSVMVHPDLEGDAADYWFLVDDTKSVKPVIMGIQRALEPKTTIGTYRDTPDHELGVEGEIAVGYGLWQLCYFSDGTA